MASAETAKRPARPHDPKGYAAAFEQLTGVTVSVRWVQLACQRGRIRAGGVGRYYIPVSEVERLARSLGLITDDAEGSA